MAVKSRTALFTLNYGPWRVGYNYIIKKKTRNEHVLFMTIFLNTPQQKTA